MKNFLLLIIFFITGCTTSPHKNTTLNNFKFIEQDYTHSNIESEKFMTLFLREYEKELLILVDKNISHGKYPFRAGTFDLSEQYNNKKHKDTELQIIKAFLIIGYRPIAMWGNEFNKYTPYCPIFYKWAESNKIYNYFKHIDSLGIKQNNRIPPQKITQYLAVSTFYYCFIFNEYYKKEKTLPNVAKINSMVYEYVLNYYVQKPEENMLDFITKNNDELNKFSY